MTPVQHQQCMGFLEPGASMNLSFYKVCSQRKSLPMRTGMIATGIFAKAAPKISYNSKGLVHGGEWYFLGVQSLAAIVIILWTCLFTFIALWVILKQFVGSSWDIVKTRATIFY